MTGRGRPHAPLLPWVVGLSAGVTAAVLLGPFMPGWGLAAGVSVGLAVLSIGAIREPQDRAVAIALHFSLALTLGFGGTTIGVTLHAIGQAGQDEIELLRRLARVGAERARARLVPRWALMLSMVPVGAIALWYRARRWAVRG